MSTAHRWDTSDRRRRLPADWTRRRQAALIRDHHRCRWITEGHTCNAKATDVDHVQAGDDHSLGNLQSLCADHHRAKTLTEARNAMRTRRQAARHPIERHPGLTQTPPAGTPPP